MKFKKSPILLNVFNRPNETLLVLEKIKEYEPNILYISSDAPRSENQYDLDNCSKVKNIISSFIDWNCEVKLRINESNLGCKITIENALEWFFEYEEMGIILEDDTLPNLVFFEYCEKMLFKYKDNNQIFSINGCNLGFNHINSGYSYSKYFNMWGWATWRRSHVLRKKYWGEFENMQNLSLIDKNWIKVCCVPQMQWYRYWENIFNMTVKNEIDTWDYQWLYTCFATKSLVIRPTQNYIVNLGFNNIGTHTKDSDHILSKLDFGLTEFKDILVDHKTFEKWYEYKYIVKLWVRFQNDMPYKVYNFVKNILKFILMKIGFYSSYRR